MLQVNLWYMEMGAMNNCLGVIPSSGERELVNLKHTTAFHHSGWARIIPGEPSSSMIL